ncbi:uncharacterized protein LOC111252129 isoform X2 [Varroa destructor]|uniref:Serum response factor-binding protein 1 n=1 Tax=Varroa destructor TaxID=109461 RepID=A0A7M7KDV7_VARDE|nr:uncharacterized protein LOC111252129 isoform X2 [Varroa destructor]XP_022665342.1 uncharacterized protein LOC111252129 isoform X2 [Varroa destructor]
MARKALHQRNREKYIEMFLSHFRIKYADWKYWVPPLLEMWDKRQKIKEERKVIGKDKKKDRPSIKEMVRETKTKRERNDENFVNKQDTDLNGESLKPRNSIETYLSDNKQRKPTDIKKGFDKHAKRARATMSTTSDSSDQAVPQINKKAISNNRRLSSKKFSSVSTNFIGESDTSAEESMTENWEEEEEPSSDEADEEVVFNRKKAARRLSTHQNGDSEGSEAEDCFTDGNSDDNNDVQRSQRASNNIPGSVGLNPFRPYAPQHIEYSDSEGSDDIWANRDTNDATRQDQKVKDLNFGKDVDNDTKQMVQENKVNTASGKSEIDENTEEENEREKDEDIEASDVTEETRHSGGHLGGESSEDSKNEMELRCKRQLPIDGLRNNKKKKLEIDFSVQNRLQCITKDMDDLAIRNKAMQQMEELKKRQVLRRANKSAEPKLGSDKNDDACSNSNDSGEAENDSSGGEDSDEGASFFLKGDEETRDSTSKTIPKEKAPSLNRRERRGHKKKSYTIDSTEDSIYRGIGRKSDFNSQRKRPFRGKAPACFSHNAELPFPEKLGPQLGYRAGAAPFERRESFGGKAINFKGRGNYSGKYSGLTKNFETHVEKDHNGAVHDMEKDRKSFKGFNKNSKSYFHQREFGNQSYNNAGSSTGYQREEKGHDWTPHQDRNSFVSGRSNERQYNTGLESQKQFQKKPLITNNRNKQSRDGTATGLDAQFQGGKQSKKTSYHKKGSLQELHPSWLAKKKLSAAINQPFQGKRIIFSDD